MLVSLDTIAVGSYVKLGGTIAKKISPYLCQNVQTNEIYYDARLFEQWKYTDAPMVEYLGRELL